MFRNENYRGFGTGYGRVSGDYAQVGSFDAVMVGIVTLAAAGAGAATGAIIDEKTEPYDVFVSDQAYERAVADLREDISEYDEASATKKQAQAILDDLELTQECTNILDKYMEGNPLADVDQSVAARDIADYDNAPCGTEKVDVQYALASYEDLHEAEALLKGRNYNALIKRLDDKIAAYEADHGQYGPAILGAKIGAGMGFFGSIAGTAIYINAQRRKYNAKKKEYNV